MSEYLGLSDRPHPTLDPVDESVYQRTPKDSQTSTSYLYPCPDCKSMVSNRAESCPHCGHFFQRLAPISINQSGWATTIANGIVLGWLAVSILAAFLFFLLFVFGVGLFSQPTRP